MVILDTIDLLFLDVGGTLIEPKRSVGTLYADALRRSGIEADPEELDNRFALAFGHEKQEARKRSGLAYGSTEASARAFWWRLFLNTLPSAARPSQDLEAVFDGIYREFAGGEAWQLFPDSLPLLQEAQRRSLPVVIVSNWDARLLPVLAHTGITPYTSGIVGSFEVGCEKPNPAIFDAAFAVANATKNTHRVLHVGDSLEEDGGAARAYGIPFRIVDRGAIHEDPQFLESLKSLYSEG